MALPPERLLLRRKRDDEPLEHLLIQKKFKRAKTPFETDYHFTRAVTDPTQNKPSTTSLSINQNRSSFDEPHVPAVRATLPGEEHDSKSSRRAKYYTAEQKDVPTILKDSAVQAKRKLWSTPRAAPRTFYLSKPSPPDCLRLRWTHGGVQKRPKRPRNALAVFTESSNVAKKIVPAQQGLPLVDDRPSSTPVEQQYDNLDREATPRRRPNASEAEIRWRRENWDKSRQPHKIRDTNISRDPFAPDASDSFKQSLEMAAELQDFSIQETAPSNGAVQNSGVKTTPVGLKYQPKSPPPRNRNVDVTKSISTSDLEMTANLDTGSEEGDYVYDTYIRHLNPSYDVSSNDVNITDPLQYFAGQNYGLLVITEEDEEAWEAYGEDDMSDKDWNSEEEDENAEDFHGNDYPEDEVDSEDEHGRRAYDYRHRASDDEEYENDNGVWSDEELESRAPWKRNHWDTFGSQDGREIDE